MFDFRRVGRLFIAGCQPDVNAIYPKVEYPVPRGTPTIANFATWEHMDDWGTLDPFQVIDRSSNVNNGKFVHLLIYFCFLKDDPLSQELIKIRLNKGSEWRYLRAHKVKGQNIIPPSVYMVNYLFPTSYFLYYHTLTLG